MPHHDSQPRAALLAVLALAVAPAIGLGIGRFAYALVLPDMQADFGWSYSEAGLPNALNAFGYFVGAVLARRAAALAGPLRLVIASSVVAALATLLSAAVGDLATLCALRVVSGLAGAFGLVAGGACAIAFSEGAGERRSLAISAFYVGPPFGIVLSALVAPAALAFGGEGAWRAAQAALGVASLALLGAFLSPSLRRVGAASIDAAGRRAPLAPMAPMLAGYACFGAGYIAYMTFMIAFLRQDAAPLVEQSAFWSAIGLAGLVSPLVWAGAFRRLDGGLGAAAAMLVTTAGAAAPLLTRAFAGEIVSAVVFGLGVFATTAATTVFLQRSLPPAEWASGVGAMTVAFSLGQTAGPVVSGAATDLFGGLGAGLGVGAALLLLGALLAVAQKPLARRP